jgi:transcriptional regulator with GAF, ATPase, and Fis domain
MAARSTTCVEIRGESGTGKELVARAVHDLSNRRGSFVAVNCGSLPPTLFEGELFGHRRGAYTGACDERPGLIRSSDGGTLFLDEVAELPAASQPALLRVLQESEVTPLGADRAVRVNLRVVTATHRDLDVEVAAGRFRADLRARLLGLQIDLPPLRDRREDLGMLIASMLERFAPRELSLSLEAAMALYAYDWPLNVRELERVLVAAASVAHDRIEMCHLSSLLRKPQEPVALPVDDDELRERLASSIERHHGNLAAVARELCKDRTQVRRWMKRFGLARGSMPIRA